MLREEFEQRLGGRAEELTTDQWNIIDYVYLNHPMFDDKDKAARLYMLYGVSIFKQLMPIAKQFEAAYNAAQAAMREATRLQAEYDQMVADLDISFIRGLRDND